MSEIVASETTRMLEAINVELATSEIFSSRESIPTSEDIVANGEVIFVDRAYEEMYLLAVDTFGENNEFDCWLTVAGQELVAASHQETLFESGWWRKSDFSEDDFIGIKCGGLSAKWVYEQAQKRKADDEFWKSKPRNYIDFKDGYVVVNRFDISCISIAGKESKSWVKKSSSCKLTQQNAPSRRSPQFFREVNDYELKSALIAWKEAGYVQPFTYTVMGSGYI